MGVPSFYRWLSEKYPKIVTNVVEDDKEGLDTSAPNPNLVEYDNLYLDMNGLIHPCCHPEGKPQPSTEEEMISDVFLYIDRIFAMVRPRRLLYMAIDGVAPRAKMNQQRSRRFRAAQEMEERRVKEDEIRDAWAKEGRPLPPRKQASWDHNVITPGTPFMHKLSQALVFYVNHRLTTDPGWANIQVIFSDATVPGEGEHKIMNFIRVQRAQTEFPPNLKHVIYGMDADLIMLSMATHEPHFTIIRETVLFGKQKGCHTCGQVGHFAADCQGAAKVKETEFDETNAVKDSPFQFLNISVLREYLAHELYVEDLPFQWDLERVIDDFVFLCFFVGNDFLPHLPSLEIREGALDDLMKLYKEKLPVIGGYLTDAGVVNLSRADVIMDHVGLQEAELLRRRHRSEQRNKQRQDQQDRDKQAKKAMKRSRSEPNIVSEETIERRSKSRRHDIPAAIAIGTMTPVLPSVRVRTPHVVGARGRSEVDNASAADALRSSILGKPSLPTDIPVANLPGPETEIDGPLNVSVDPEIQSVEDDDNHRSGVSPADISDEFSVFLKQTLEELNRVPDAPDTIMFHEAGYKDRYYLQKFGFKRPENDADIREVARCYTQGLCWVMLYYYKGCQSWEWFYPYHYAPFASDLRNMDQFDVSLELGKPFSPFSQLMGVLPAASSHCLPPKYRDLMKSPTSPILHFYPTDFKIDLNGKKWAWQAVVLLPFIEQNLLLSTIDGVRHSLTADEQERDCIGADFLFTSSLHSLGNSMAALYLKCGNCDAAELRNFVASIDTSKSGGIVGQISPYLTAARPAATLKLHLGAFSQKLKHNRAVSTKFISPVFTTHKTQLLPGFTPSSPILSTEDFSTVTSFRRYGGRSLMFNSGDNNRAAATGSQQIVSAGGIRMVQHNLPRSRQSDQFHGSYNCNYEYQAHGQDQRFQSRSYPEDGRNPRDRMEYPQSYGRSEHHGDYRHQRHYSYDRDLQASSYHQSRYEPYQSESSYSNDHFHQRYHGYAPESASQRERPIDGDPYRNQNQSGYYQQEYPPYAHHSVIQHPPPAYSNPRRNNLHSSSNSAPYRHHSSNRGSTPRR
uniref:5'-3' exoribonuclease n=1 Tax=Spongospora subterranea TaxID=70186 RepID=A0A0H5QGU4_9EUKA|eukprot:CRZ01200.1 hypothetical protein [Spongospora subterranea]